MKKNIHRLIKDNCIVEAIELSKINNLPNIDLIKKILTSQNEKYSFNYLMYCKGLAEEIIVKGLYHVQFTIGDIDFLFPYTIGSYNNQIKRLITINDF